jgi:hypothetical protein
VNFVRHFPADFTYLQVCVKFVGESIRIGSGKEDALLRGREFYSAFFNLQTGGIARGLSQVGNSANDSLVNKNLQVEKITNLVS